MIEIIPDQARWQWTPAPIGVAPAETVGAGPNGSNQKIRGGQLRITSYSQVALADGQGVMVGPGNQPVLVPTSTVTIELAPEQAKSLHDALEGREPSRVVVARTLPGGPTG